MKRAILPGIIFLTVVFLFFSVFAGEIQAGYVPPENPAKTAETFVRALGSGEYLTAYQLMTGHARRKISEYGIKRFYDLEEHYFSQSEMDFFLQTNAEGHRTIVFDDLVLRYSKNFGGKSSVLKSATGSTLRREGEDRAIILIRANGRSRELVMTREDGKWKAAWYPY